MLVLGVCFRVLAGCTRWWRAQDGLPMRDLGVSDAKLHLAWICGLVSTEHLNTQSNRLKVHVMF